MSGARKHAVFGSDPTLALALQKTGNTGLNTGSTQYLGIAKLNEDGAFSVAGVLAGDRDRAQLVGVTA